MTGLFQIFDRYKALTRSKSTQKKVAISNEDAAEGADRDPSCIFFAYHMFQDESAQRRATLEGHLAQAEVTREPRRSSIDNSEVMSAKALVNSKDLQSTGEPKSQPARISLDSRPKPRLSFYLKEEPSANNDPLKISKDVPMVVAKEPPRNSFSGLLQRRNSDPTVVTSRLSVDGKTSGKEEKERKSRDFRGMFRGSFLRKESRVNNRESPGGSFSSKEGEQLRRSSNSLGDEKEGLKLNVPISGADDLAGDGENKYSRFIEGGKGWIESRDGLTPRLTVELKEGPQLTCKDDQRGHVDDLPRPSNLQNPGRCVVQKGHTSTQHELLKTVDYKDLQKDQRDRVCRSVDGKDPPRSSVDPKAVALKHSVDGQSTPQQSLSTPRVSVDGRDSNHQGAGHHGDKSNANRSSETSTTVSPKVDNPCTPLLVGQSNWENDLEGSRWKASSVVARLMGLEGLPNFDVVPPVATGVTALECKPPQMVFHDICPDESPHPLSKDYHNLVYQADEVLAVQQNKTPTQIKSRDTSQHLVQEVDLVLTPPKIHLDSALAQEPDNKGHQTPASPKQLPMSPKHHMIESMPQALKHPVEQKSYSEGMLYGDMDQRLRQLGLKNSIQERKTLKQILEAMHLKGLLHPPRHMENDGKHMLLKQDQPGSVAKSLFQDSKDSSLPQSTTSLKPNLFDLDYKDIPKFRSAQKMKGFEDTVQNHDRIDSSLRRRNFNGEASIVVMKPLNMKPASKPVTVKPSPSLPQSKEIESMPVYGPNASKKLLKVASSRTLEKDASLSTCTGISTKSETVVATIKHRQRSRSVEPRKQNQEEELPITLRQRRERIAARTAKGTLDGGHVHLQDSSKVTRSSSPTVAKKPVKATPPARSAFGSSISQTVDRKSRVKPIIDRAEIKSTHITRRSKSSSELLKERTIIEQESPKVLNRSRSDSRLGANVERSASPEQSSLAKGPAEVAVLRSKRTIGRVHSNERSSSLRPVIVETLAVRGRSREKVNQEDHRDSTANPCIEPKNVLSDRSQNGNQSVVLSPPLSLPEKRRSKFPLHYAEKPPDEIKDTQGSGTPKAEDTAQQIRGDTSARAHILFNSRNKSKQLGSTDEVVTDERTKLSTPQEESMEKLQKCTEDTCVYLANGFEQPSPISVLDNINFQEEGCTPSPQPKYPGSAELQGGSTVIGSNMGLEDSKTNNSQPLDPATPVLQIPALKGDPIKDLIYTVARSLDLDDLESYLNKPTLEIQVPYVADNSAGSSTSSVPSALKTKEDERAYVTHIMIASGVTEEASSHSDWLLLGQIIKTDFFDQLEEHLEVRESARKQNVYLSGEERTEYLKEALHRRLLFDCINNILERKLQPYLNPQPWGSQILRKKPVGVILVQEVWEELQEIHARTLDDDTLYTILQKDFAQKGEKWVDFSIEVGEIGMEVEEMMFYDMMDAAVQELMIDCADKLESSRPGSRAVSPCLSF